jgi:hypothetical protein
MLSFFLSTVAYFIASYFLKRYLERMGVQKSATRGVLIFSCALTIAYGVAALVDWATG